VAADRAANAAVDAGGQRDSLAFDDPADEQRARRVEMEEEMDGSGVGPLTGAIPGPARKALLVAVPVATALGAVLGLGIAMIAVGSWGLFSRLVVYGLVGAACGSTVGFLVGGSLAVRGPEDPMAVDRGMIVGVSVASRKADVVASAMADHGPIALDILTSNGVGKAIVSGEPSIEQATRSVVERLRSR
jgi:hypothetical protein